MNTASPRFQMFRVTLCLSCLVTAAGVGQAQQYPQQPQYASTYYPPQQPTVKERIQNAGQNVGDFFRRTFYGESAPTSYPQQPAYHQGQGYSLDAPAQPVVESSGTGFQRAVQGTMPKYVKPPIEEAAPAPPTKPATTTKAPAPRTSTKVSAPAPATPTPKKRYTPAKPSTFSTPKSTSKAASKRVEDAPPSSSSSSTLPSSKTEPSRYDAPANEPVNEAKLNSDIYPLPGGSPSASGTVGGTETEPTPKTSVTKPTTNTSSSTLSPSTTTGSTTVTGTKSAGDFPIGKKASKPGRVVSPFAPFNELDITGLPSGSLALDPTTQQVFQVP